MKYLLVILIISIASCKKTEQNAITEPVVFKDSFSVTIRNSLSADITNVMQGQIIWDYDDDIDTKAHKRQDLGDIKKDGSTTFQLSLHDDHGDVIIWFDFLSETYWLPVSVHGYDKTYSITSERKLWEQVEKTSNRYPN